MKIEETLIDYIINWEDLKGKLSIGEIINLLGRIRDLKQKQNILGFSEHIEFLTLPYLVMEWTAPKTIAFVSVGYSQTSYSPEDYWELWIDGDRIFETIYTKQLGEVKHSNTIHWIKEGQTIRLIHYNISGTTKEVWVDLELAGDIHDNA